MVSFHILLRNSLEKDLLVLYDRLVDLGVEYRNGHVYLADIPDTSKGRSDNLRLSYNYYRSENQMDTIEYSKRLGPISVAQFQAALDHFKLGQFVSAEAIPFGLFGQNVFIKSTTGDYALRGAAHYDWQFPEEQFFAKLLHEQTNVPVPWPYLYDENEAIFGWRYGYVIMPRMPGLQLADTEVIKKLSLDDRKSIAVTLGENLHEVQTAKWATSGRYDLSTKTIKPLDDSFQAWIIGEIRQWFQKSMDHNTGTTDKDREWLEKLIYDSSASLKIPFAPALVLRDYKEANLTVEKERGRWRVSGVFDLMEALIGDGELDLARQMTTYMEEDVSLAKNFTQGYLNKSPLREQANERLAFYIAYDRMIVWEYFHRPEHLHMWWYETKTLHEWIQSYISQLEKILPTKA